MNIKLKSITHGLDGNYRGSEKDTANNYILEDAMCDFSMCVNSSCMTCVSGSTTRARDLSLLCIRTTGLGANTHTCLVTHFLLLHGDPVLTQTQCFHNYSHPLKHT